LLDGDLSSAVNAPAVGGDEMRRLRPAMDLARQLGILGAAVAGPPIGSIEFRYGGSAARGMRLLASNAGAGVMSGVDGGSINLVNAMRLAEGHGIKVAQEK